jgi:hypothetical protein
MTGDVLLPPRQLVSTTLDVLAREYFAKTIREEQEKSFRQRAVDPDLLVTTSGQRSRR